MSNILFTQLLTENLIVFQSILQITAFPVLKEVNRKTALFGLKRKTQGSEIPKSVVEIVLTCFPSLVIWWILSDLYPTI
jgi:hypothetical protein